MRNTTTPRGRRRRPHGSIRRLAVVIGGAAAAGIMAASGVVLSGAVDSPASAHVRTTANADPLSPLQPEHIDGSGHAGNPVSQRKSASGTQDAVNSGGGTARHIDSGDHRSRKISRRVLPGCDGDVPKGSASNGQLPESWLCDIGVDDFHLRADAAVAFAKMNAAYESQTGSSLCMTDAYRPIGVQRGLKSRKPGLAAVPGTSQHGWGIAIDFGCKHEPNGQRQWLTNHAEKYGWENPHWAKTSKYEPWHFEWAPGRGKNNR